MFNFIKNVLMWIGIIFAAVMGVIAVVASYTFLLVVSLIPFMFKVGIVGVILYFVAKWIGLI